MAFKINKLESQKIEGIKCLIYGSAGIGKTMLTATAPKPLLLNFEKGTLCLQNKTNIQRIYGDKANTDIDTITLNKINTESDFKQFKSDLDGLFQALKTSKDYETLVFDSLTEFCDIVLEYATTKNKDGRQAYMQVQNYIVGVLKELNNLPVNVVLIAKEDILLSEGKPVKIRAMLTGQALPPKVPYIPDEVFYMHKALSSTGEMARCLTTQPDSDFCLFDAKDRSGSLALHERPNLTNIFNKIKGMK